LVDTNKAQKFIEWATVSISVRIVFYNQRDVIGLLMPWDKKLIKSLQFIFKA